MRFKNGEPWRFVSAAEFEAFVRSYPRPLEAHPPLDRKANFRSYSDPTLGPWPGNIVATVNTGRRNALYGVREDIFLARQGTEP